MMVALILAALLQAAASTAAPVESEGTAAAHRMHVELPAARTAMDQCYRDTVLRLGAGNAESADTLVKAARSICSPAIERVRLSMPDIYLGREFVASRVATFQDGAENAAIAALLVARHPAP